MTRKYAKSFNSKSRDARKYSITTFTDFLRYTLQDWFVKRIDLVDKYNGPLATNIEKDLRASFERATSLIVHPFSRFKFYVQDIEKDSEVNLQLQGI